MGTRPVRASGSTWVSHKVNAVKRVLSRYGAYTNHLIALSEDSTVRHADKGKLRGYCNQWTDAKYILGCAVFADILTPAGIFSKVMQSDELDIVAALTSLLRTIKEMEKLRSLPLTQWPVYFSTMKKLTEEDGHKVRHLGDSLRQRTTTPGTMKNSADRLQNSCAPEWHGLILR